MTDEHAVELKPCPFCGAVELKIYAECVHCHVCGSESDEYVTIDGAILSWNTRPLEDALLTRAEVAEARVAQLERAIADSPLEAERLRSAIDEALAIIAGGNPGLPAEVLAEVELRLQEAWKNDNRN